MRKIGSTQNVLIGGVPIPSDVWCPKGGFKGLAFAKFIDISIRDKFVSKIIVAKPEYEGIQVWARAEAPVEVRACEIFLSGLKKILVGWGFDFTCIRYDVEGTEKTLKVNNEVKVSVSVRDGKFHCEWEEGWKNRESLHSSPEMQALLTKVGELVSGAGKGKGKGKTTFE